MKLVTSHDISFVPSRRATKHSSVSEQGGPVITAPLVGLGYMSVNYLFLVQVTCYCVDFGARISLSEIGAAMVKANASAKSKITNLIIGVIKRWVSRADYFF